MAEAHILVLQKESGEILMAMPFSAVPTRFEVKSKGVDYWGTCMWDALGIPAALQADADIHSQCPDCGEALDLTLERHLWTPQFAASVQATYEDFADDFVLDRAATTIGDIGVTQRLPYGG